MNIQEFIKANPLIVGVLLGGIFAKFQAFWSFILDIFWKLFIKSFRFDPNNPYLSIPKAFELLKTYKPISFYNVSKILRYEVGSFIPFPGYGLTFHITPYGLLICNIWEESLQNTLESKTSVIFSFFGMTKHKEELFLKTLLVEKEKDTIQKSVILSTGSFLSIIKKLNTENFYIDPQLDNLFSSLSTFKNAKEQYQKNAEPWSTGILLYGEPGSGKSTAVKLIASKLDIPIIIIGATSFNSNLNKAICAKSLEISYSSLLPLVDANNKRIELHIFVVEDIDCILSERTIASEENENGKGAFSDLLNYMSGSLAPEGIIWIFTTNYKDKLDSALIRKGRIDHVINLEKTSEFQSFVNKKQKELV